MEPKLKRAPGAGRPRIILDAVLVSAKLPRSHVRALARYGKHLGVSGVGACLRAVLDSPADYEAWLGSHAEKTATGA